MSNISIDQKERAADQIKELQGDVDYDVRDYPISFIVSNFDSEDYFVPDYQRAFIWSADKQSRFIESLLLDLPIPLIFLSDTESGKLEIVDGVQRINTLSSFLNNNLKLTGLKKLTEVNDFYFEDLHPSQQRRLKNKALRIIVLRVSTSTDIRKELFDRLNTSAEIARDSEVRRGAFEGPFMKFIEELSQMPIMSEVAPVSQKNIRRGEQIELVLRFFAYSNNYKEFKHSVQIFINDYISKTKDSFDEQAMRKEFEDVFEFAKKYFPHGFKKTEKSKSVPRVRFEALSVGIALALKERPNLVPKDIIQWLESKEFKELTTSDGSNSRVRVEKRIQYVRDSLLGE